MNKRTVPIHYLRANESVWTPPTVICFDTETFSAAEAGSEVHTLRLWVARCADRRTPKGVAPIDDCVNGMTGEDLAHQVHAWCKQRKTVWIYAHNLHFDLCTSDLIAELRLLGWTVTDFAVDGSVPFVRMERGDHHLTVCDSWSWLPVGLEAVGDAVSVPKPPLPAAGDSAADWLERCESDVTILSAAMLALMDWWDVNKLGRWSITGGMSGWNVMRHIPTHRRILINPDPGQIAADRTAIYGGRRGVWHTGNLPRGRYVELDLERAYTTVCRDLPLPCERIARFDSLPVDHLWVTSQRYGIIAQVTIDTDVPRWPCRLAGRVWYPVGRFTTVLAGPDIAEAARLGCLRSIGAGWLHRLGWSLRPWALWCLDRQADTSGAVPDVCKIMLRHWGRSTVGKWAQRGFERVQLGAAPTAGWGFIEGWNHGAGVKASIVDFGGIRWQVSASNETDNTYPAILAFVESYVRVALGRVIDAIGDKAMVCCDTDGAIVDSTQIPAFDDAIQAAQPFTLRMKRVFKTVTMLGPQHYIVDGQRQFSGVPRSAEPTADGKLTALLWPKLAWQMRHGRAGTYVRPAQDYRMATTYAPGWVLSDGSVAAVEVTAAAGGCQRVTPWTATRSAERGAVLGPDQNPALKGYYVR